MKDDVKRLLIFVGDDKYMPTREMCENFTEYYQKKFADFYELEVKALVLPSNVQVLDITEEKKGY